MKIISCAPDLSTDRMYCPSTNEIIFAPDYEMINGKASAVIAYWHSEVFNTPEIKDATLQKEWKKYYKKWERLSEDLNDFEIVKNFLKTYTNPNWVVYECTFTEMACGPISESIYLVVNADTIVEVDPNHDHDENPNNDW